MEALRTATRPTDRSREAEVAAASDGRGLLRKLLAGQQMLVRSAIVFFCLFPFFIELVRDRRRFILLGGRRRISTAILQRRARKLRETISRLGPTFIKLGQILSLRADLFPPEYIAELSKLQDQVPPVPVDEIVAVIESQLHRPLGQIFAHYELQPDAAASLGQVHRAVLADGRAVAVKVLRPGVESTVLQDTLILIRLGEALCRYTRWGLADTLLNVFNEFSVMIRKEMDFEEEGRNVEEFRRIFQDVPHIRIPAVDWSLTTRQVLVTEFIEGIKIDQVADIYRLGLKPEAILELLTKAYLYQALTVGVLHADPHPGNILVTPQTELAFLDFGMIVRFAPELKKQLLNISIAGVQRDVDTLMLELDELGVIDPEANIPVLRDAIALLLDHFDRIHIGRGRLEQVVNDILQTVYRFPLRLPSNLVYLFKIAVMVEGIGTLYLPNFSGISYATPFVKDMLAVEILAARKGLGQQAAEKVREVYRLTKMAARVLYRADREMFRIRAHPMDVIMFQRYVTNLARRMLLGMFSLGMAIVTAMLYDSTRSGLILTVGWIVSFLVLVVAMLIPYRWGAVEQRRARRRASE